MNDVHAIACQRCGNCCTIDMMAYVSAEDRKRWENEGRTDILDRLDDNSVIWAGDRIISRSGSNVTHCFYLNSDGTVCTCGIYPTRPGVCRDYAPGSSELCPLYFNKSR
ncbi:MAG: YkgJ family cysteine cluster protein [Syntrophorhabdaceae bacterium]|nr:YkgJ family cysteine cluster protein [Syntrophorhabdaceae bacterium]MDD4195624.1 YkgJ family cysteine cluster protein [Syntrophorhabdaceae bacterium]HOC46102.1 YkgJ family cysteine cluster protein [Syntrophorhabdaceae bacterium]